MLNDDLTTDHFAIITGCGREPSGKLFFNVTDNFYKSQIFYCKCDNFELESKDTRIDISQIRKSIKR